METKTDMLSSAVITECINMCHQAAVKLDELAVDLSCRMGELDGEARQHQWKRMKALMSQSENYNKLGGTFQGIRDDYMSLHEQFNNTVELMNKLNSIVPPQ